MEHLREQIIVTPRAVIDRLGTFQGFTIDHARYLEEIFQPGYHAFWDRALVETIPTLKQPIVYTVLTDEEGRIVTYRRAPKSGEQRLVNKLSCGIGGHLTWFDGSPMDLSTGDLLHHARREIREEFNVGRVGLLTLRGLINDDRTPVGEVHLGIVLHARYHKPLSIREPENIVELNHFTREELFERYDELEPWSQLVVSNLSYILGK